MAPRPRRVSKRKGASSAPSTCSWSGIARRLPKKKATDSHQAVVGKATEPSFLFGAHWPSFWFGFERAFKLEAGRFAIVTLSLGFLLAIIALICGVLMLVAGRWSRLPLAAIAIICLALNESGLLASLAR